MQLRELEHVKSCCRRRRCRRRRARNKSVTRWKKRRRTKPNIWIAAGTLWKRFTVSVLCCTVCVRAWECVLLRKCVYNVVAAGFWRLWTSQINAVTFEPFFLRSFYSVCKLIHWCSFTHRQTLLLTSASIPLFINSFIYFNSTLFFGCFEFVYFTFV